MGYGVAQRFAHDKQKIAIDSFRQRPGFTFDPQVNRDVHFVANRFAELFESAGETSCEGIAPKIPNGLSSFVKRKPKLDASAVEILARGVRFGWVATRGGLEQRGGAHATLDYGIVHIAGNA